VESDRAEVDSEHGCPLPRNETILDVKDIISLLVTQ
jgi:hypothetical protein